MLKKIIDLLCQAHNKATDASAFDDATYAQQLEVEANHLIANGLTIPVHCKDCVHMTEIFGGRYCKVWTMFNGMGDDGFCNYGERKENG